MSNILAHYLFESNIVDEQIYSFQTLLEDRLDFIKNKYKGSLNDVVDHLATNQDPSKNKKFTEWLVDRHLKGDDVFHKDVRSGLEMFDKASSKHHDTNIKNHTIDSMLDTAHIIKNSLAEEAKPLEQVFKEDGVTGFKIPNAATSKKIYGHGRKFSTTWCTAADSTNNMFDSYDGGKYTCHLPNGEFFQIHHQSNQAKDPSDTEIHSFKTDDRYSEHHKAIENFFIHTANLEKIPHEDRSLLTNKFGGGFEEVDRMISDHMKQPHMYEHIDSLIGAAPTHRLLPHQIEYISKHVDRDSYYLSTNPNIDPDTLDHHVDRLLASNNVDKLHALVNKNLHSKTVNKILEHSLNDEHSSIPRTNAIKPENIDHILKNFDPEKHSHEFIGELSRSNGEMFSDKHIEHLNNIGMHQFVFNIGGKKKLPESVRENEQYKDYEKTRILHFGGFEDKKQYDDHNHISEDILLKAPNSSMSFAKFALSAKNSNDKVVSHIYNSVKGSDTLSRHPILSSDKITHDQADALMHSAKKLSFDDIDEYAKRKDAKFDVAIKHAKQHYSDSNIELYIQSRDRIASIQNPSIDHVRQFHRAFLDSLDRHHKDFTKEHLDAILDEALKSNTPLARNEVSGLIGHPSLNVSHLEKLSKLQLSYLGRRHIVNSKKVPQRYAKKYEE